MMSTSSMQSLPLNVSIYLGFHCLDTAVFYTYEMLNGDHMTNQWSVWVEYEKY